MSDDIDGPEWDPPELLDSDAPEIYIAGAGRVQQVVRTLSAVIATAAIVWGVLWLGDESTKQTDLMEQQNTILTCHSEQETDLALLVNAISLGLDVDDSLRLREIFRECRGE